MNKKLEDALGNLTQQAYNSANNEKQLQKDKEHYELIKKHLDALEIIKEKEPDISFIFSVKDLNQYNSCVWKEQVLTQKEYDLLKEVLY